MVSNFLIVGTQRTGSTALAESLNAHAEVACGAEWPRRVRWPNKMRCLKRAFKGDFTALAPRHREKITEVYHPQTRWLGCKLLFRASDKWLVHPRFAPALWLDQLESSLRWLSGQPDIHIIHLVRCDAIEWLKSKYMAEATGLYTGRQYPEGVKIDISLPKAVKRLYAKNWIDDRLTILANSNPYIRVCYEDFLECNHSVLVSVLQFLQCNPELLTRQARQIQKQSKKTASDYIINYKILVAELESRGLLQAQLCK